MIIIWECQTFAMLILLGVQVHQDGRDRLQEKCQWRKRQGMSVSTTAMTTPTTKHLSPWQLPPQARHSKATNGDEVDSILIRFSKLTNGGKFRHYSNQVLQDNQWEVINGSN